MSKYLKERNLLKSCILLALLLNVTQAYSSGNGTYRTNFCLCQMDVYLLKVRQMLSVGQVPPSTPPTTTPGPTTTNTASTSPSVSLTTTNTGTTTKNTASTTTNTGSTTAAASTTTNTGTTTKNTESTTVAVSATTNTATTTTNTGSTTAAASTTTNTGTTTKNTESTTAAASTTTNTGTTTKNTGSTTAAASTTTNTGTTTKNTGSTTVAVSATTNTATASTNTGSTTAASSTSSTAAAMGKRRKRQASAATTTVASASAGTGSSTTVASASAGTASPTTVASASAGTGSSTTVASASAGTGSSTTVASASAGTGTSTTVAKTSSNTATTKTTTKNSAATTASAQKITLGLSRDYIAGIATPTFGVVFDSSIKLVDDYGVFFDPDYNPSLCPCSTNQTVEVGLCLLNVPYNSSYDNINSTQSHAIVGKLLPWLDNTLITAFNSNPIYIRVLPTRIQIFNNKSAQLFVNVNLRNVTYKPDFYINNAISPSLTVVIPPAVVMGYQIDTSQTGCYSVVDVTPVVPVVLSPLYYLRFLCIPIALAVLALMIFCTCCGSRDQFYVRFW